MNVTALALCIMAFLFVSIHGGLPDWMANELRWWRGWWSYIPEILNCSRWLRR